MIVEILTLEEVLFSKEAVSVIVPGENGTFEMLDNHVEGHKAARKFIRENEIES